MKKSKNAANPWAICNAMKKKKGWSKQKTERCIKKVKRRQGLA
jgi:hypothetical protein